MPHLPPDKSPGLLCNFNPEMLEAWMDGGDIPHQGPHTVRPTQFGCTIKEDYVVAAARAALKKGMQGHLIEERDTQDGKKAKIFIRGVTESFFNGKWVQNLWVPASIIDKGVPWKTDIKNWKITLNLSAWPLNTTNPFTAPDTTTVGITVSRLLETFQASPARLMGTKIQDTLDKRNIDIGYISRAIIRGMKDANVYDVLNKPNFRVTDILASATRHTIDSNYSRDTGGVYLRYHVSTSNMAFWKPNTAYVYVGKSVNFRDSFLGHATSTTKYGELTRNSQRLVMVALCIMNEQDNLDFSFLVEQIFVCLFESHRSDLLANTTSIVQSDGPLERIEALEAVSYFRSVSEQVFQETGYPGAIRRAGFEVAYGANYSMPYTEWTQFSEHALFIRHDTRVKDKNTGESMPIAVFKTMKPRLAHYHKAADGTSRMLAFRKNHKSDSFFSIQLVDRVGDGTTAPLQDATYYVVFEVRTDGQPHPQAWSRLPDIGSFINWNQGRSLAARIEWEYPLKSGSWRTTYLQAANVYMFVDRSIAGSNLNFAKTISMIQWLFDATPNHNHAWITRLTGSAHVLHAVYDYHTQSLEIKNQAPIAMHSGARRTIANIIAAMNQPRLGLLNVDGLFGAFPNAPDPSVAVKRKLCDTCTMMKSRDLAALHVECTPTKVLERCCQLCFLFGRPCCSWTATGAVRRTLTFTADTSTKVKVTSDDVAKHKIVRSALVVQPRWVGAGDEQGFTQGFFDFMSLAKIEDDVEEVHDDDDQPDEDVEDVDSEEED